MSFEGDPFNIVLTKFTGQPHTAEPYKHSGTSFPSFHILTESYVQILIFLTYKGT